MWGWAGAPGACSIMGNEAALFQSPGLSHSTARVFLGIQDGLTRHVSSQLCGDKVDQGLDDSWPSQERGRAGPLEASLESRCPMVATSNTWLFTVNSN
jgi:hypothetical protein